MRSDALGSGRIDVHQHAILPEYRKALQRAGVIDRPPKDGMDGLGSELHETVFTTQSILAVADEMGTAGAVLLPFSVAGIHHGDDANARYLTRATNEAVAALAGGAPDRLGFYAILPAPDVDGALAELEYAMDTLGADGVAFLSTQNGVYIGDRALDPLYAEMDRRGIVAFIHPARPAYTLPLDLWPPLIEYPFETTRAAVNLIYNGALAEFPRITWILAHAGGTLPYLSERLKALLEAQDPRRPSFRDRFPQGVEPLLKQFYYDTAIAGAAPAMSALVAVADPSHIVYGSDWPYPPKAEVVEQVRSLRAMPLFVGERLAAVERGNAAAIFSRFRKA
jgi:predicted TIM-barrel fold metal-dependent hydrolase